MAKANLNALDLSALSFETVGSDKRVVTSDAVARPVRDIMAEINTSVRRNAWAATLQTIASMHDQSVEAKGAAYEVNDDEAARAIRVNYNLMQPDYYPSRKTRKMTLEASQKAWTQICEQIGKPAPTFTVSNDDGDNE